MLFILFFTFGILSVPLVLDFNKHGRNNILVRSAQEAQTLPGVSHILSLAKIFRRSLTAKAGQLSILVIKIVVLALAICLVVTLIAFSSFDLPWVTIGVVGVGVAMLVRLRF